MNEKTDKPSFTILVVDDEPKNIQLLGNLLQDNGYMVEFALNGEQALEWIKTRPFDLILLDVMMPGTDGFEVCRHIKADIRTRHIPVIFITAKTETDDIVQGFDVGGSDYVTKPFKSPELLARVKMHAEMKVLRGLLPICSKCKAIRDDQGIWKKIEAYLSQNSSALFTHGLCPKCMKELYGDEEWFEEEYEE